MIKPIDLTETFPHLSKAPIVEAALDIRVVPSVKWDETVLQNELKQHLPDYAKIKPLRETKVEFTQEKPANPKVEDFGCVGFKLHSNASPHIVQFKKEAFVFSRLKPYENWEQLSEEALRLWAIYYELLKPSKVIRIGLRFINRIAIMQSSSVNLSDYYRYPPNSSLKELNWPLIGYLHHDIIQVPGTQYSVNLIKTLQRIQNIPEIGLILDIDVFMENPFEYNKVYLTEYLKEMRWIKNKIFFNSLTEKTIEELK